MKNEAIRSLFTAEESDVINDVMIAAHSPSESALSQLRERHLVDILRGLLVNDERLAAYTQLLARSTKLELDLPATVADAVLVNRFEQLSNRELLDLALNVDGLHILREMIAEDPDDNWTDQIIRDGSEYVIEDSTSDRASFMDAGHNEDAETKKSDAFFQSVELVPPEMFVSVRGAGMAGPFEPQKLWTAMSSASPHDIAARLWKVRVADGHKITLPKAVAMRCFGISPCEVVLLLELLRFEEDDQRVVFRGAIEPPPRHESLSVIIILASGERIALEFAACGNEPAAFSETVAELRLDRVPVKIETATLEMR